VIILDRERIIISLEEQKELKQGREKAKRVRE